MSSNGFQELDELMEIMCLQMDCGQHFMRLYQVMDIRSRDLVSARKATTTMIQYVEILKV